MPSLLNRQISRRRLGAIALGAVAATVAAGANQRRAATSDAAPALPTGKKSVYTLPSMDHKDAGKPGCRCARCLGMNTSDSQPA